mmetsp:Transcript_35851/g.77553  ORF Transcript_35851/g.77553 Transcript_35851/m.77553 type:complete len:183 (+) Transcript_35851:57-605(+)
MVSALGGKWTTFRRMAEDAVDAAIEHHPSLGMVAGPCRTRGIQVIGADRAKQVCAGQFHKVAITLRETYELDKELAEYLLRNYGTRALQVVEANRKNNVRLAPKYPFLASEISFAVQHEYALSLEDVLARRLRVAFMDRRAALDMLPKVADIMATELKWSRSQKRDQIAAAQRFLDTMCPSA